MQQTAAMPRARMADRRILITALLLGAIAAALAVVVIARAAPQAAPAEAMKQIVVASNDIAAGARIDGEMLRLKSVPVSAVVAGASSDISAVVGYTARYPIPAGEQISPPRLVEPPKVQALSFQIPAGRRAFAIPVNSTQSPVSLVAPGDFVDLLVAATADRLVTASNVVTGPSQMIQAINPPPGPAGGQAVSTLLQNVQVLSVQANYVADGRTYEASTRGTPTEGGANVSYVTLALTPEQAQLVWLASQEGKLTLTLRPFGDEKVQPVGIARP